MVLVILQGVKNVDELYERSQEEEIISSSHRSAPQGIQQVSRKPSGIVQIYLPVFLVF
jgi:hypothetical protein